MQFTYVYQEEHKSVLAHALSYSTVLGQPGKGLLTHLCVNLLTDTDAIFHEISIKRSTYIIQKRIVCWITVEFTPLINMSPHVHFVNNYMLFC